MSKRDDNVRPAPEISFGEDVDVEDVDLAVDEVMVDGRRLTDERAGEIAADVLGKARGFNAGLVPGGKSLSGGSKHSPVVQVRVSERTRDQLQLIAATRKVSVSKLSRQVLDEYVKAHGAG